MCLLATPAQYIAKGWLFLNLGKINHFQDFEPHVKKFKPKLIHKMANDLIAIEQKLQSRCNLQNFKREKIPTGKNIQNARDTKGLKKER